MAELTTKKRNALKKSTFAIPETRSYPIPDESHARNALSRVAQNGSPDEKKRVRAAVHRKFPGIDKGSGMLTMLGQRTLAGFQTKYGTEAGHAKFEEALKRGVIDRSKMEK